MVMKRRTPRRRFDRRPRCWTRSRVHSRSAFALLDVLLGGIVLSIALVAVFGLSSQALTSQVVGEKRMQAAMLADVLLNQVLAVGPEEYSSRFATSGVADPPFDDFEYEIVIRDEGVGRPFTVTATIYWFVGGREYEEVVETKVAPLMGDIEEDERIPERPVNRDSG